MKAYLLYMKKGVSSVDDKVIKNDNDKLRSFVASGGRLWGVW